MIRGSSPQTYRDNSAKFTKEGSLDFTNPRQALESSENAALKHTSSTARLNPAQPRLKQNLVEKIINVHTVRKPVPPDIKVS